MFFIVTKKDIAQNKCFFASQVEAAEAEWEWSLVPSVLLCSEIHVHIGENDQNNQLQNSKLIPTNGVPIYSLIKPLIQSFQPSNKKKLNSTDQ